MTVQEAMMEQGLMPCGDSPLFLLFGGTTRPASPAEARAQKEYAVGRVRVVPRTPEDEWVPVWELSMLKVRSGARRQGYGTTILGAVLGAARQAGARVVLKAEAFDDKPMSDRQLAAWYRRWGFAPMRGRRGWLVAGGTS